MYVAQLLLYEILFFGALGYVVLTAVVGDELEEVMKGLFFAGALGWGIAFFTQLYPLIFVQRLVVFLISGRTDTAAASAYASRWEVMILPPIFASIFGEITRYLTVRQKAEMAIDRKRGPFVFGLGWGLAETIVIFGLGGVGAFISGAQISVSLSGLILTLIERLSVVALYVSMSYLIFYSRYEEGRVPPSLLVALAAHFIYSVIPVVWSLIISPGLDLSGGQHELGVILSSASVSLLIIHLVRRLVIPRGESLASRYLQSVGSAGPSTEKFNS